MTTTATSIGKAAFDSYWAAVQQEVAHMASQRPVFEEMAIRSNESSTVHAVRMMGIGGHPLFAYYSAPHGKGPFPVVFEAPGYGSVRGVPAVERRAKYAVMAVCHRGQRLSDGMQQAAYPGLLTDGLPGAGSYRWREVVADCLAAFDVMLGRPEVDASRIAVAGNDLAAIVAALRPQSKLLLLNGQLLFRGPPDRLAATQDYPLQEFNDFRRAHGAQWPQAAATLGLFDPLAFAGSIRADTLIACINADAGPAEPFAAALKGKVELRTNSGYGYLDHEYQERWLAERL